MKRSVFASALTLLFCSVSVSLAVAQAKPAVSQAKTTAPAQPDIMALHIAPMFMCDTSGGGPGW